MTVNTDFYVPDFLIFINGEPFRYGDNVDVVSVSITETINQADSFTFTVREHNPQPGRFASGEMTWLDSERFEEGNIIRIEMGYQGNRTVRARGEEQGPDGHVPGKWCAYVGSARAEPVRRSPPENTTQALRR